MNNLKLFALFALCQSILATRYMTHFLVQSLDLAMVGSVGLVVTPPPFWPEVVSHISSPYSDPQKIVPKGD